MKNQPYAARYSVAEYSATVQSGQTITVVCDITNSGALTWEIEGSRPVRVAYRWLDARGAVLEPDGRRTEFASAVSPGATARVELIVVPSAPSGQFILQIDLVAEQYAWFRELGQPTLDLPVRIEPLAPNSMRVCILNTNCLLNDAVGGCVVEQVKYFEAQGHAVHVLAEYVDQRLPLDVRRAVFHTSYDELRIGLEVESRSWLARQFFEADLYIFHYSVYYPLIESIQFVQGGAIIFDYHGLTPPHLWGDASGVDFLLEGQQKAALAQLADYAIVHSQYMADELQHYSGIARERIRVMPYAVAVDQFAPRPRDAALVKRYGLADQRVLLYIGRMAGNKRIDVLVRMLAAVCVNYPATKLLLVGDDEHPAYRPLVEQARALAQQLGCAEQVVFTGPINHTELHRFYSLCDIYVTSSLHEGFCIPVIEAMACGKPVVATDITALPETVGDAGLLFPAEDDTAMAAQVVRILNSL